MTKYAANAMLAARISLINEIANLCEALGSDVEDVRRGVGLDRRIGPAFLFPGVGYGGSCFPKDVKALIRMAEASGVSPRILRAVDEVNDAQKRPALRQGASATSARICRDCASPSGGCRSSRAPTTCARPRRWSLIRALLDAGVQVQAHDPEALRAGAAALRRPDRLSRSRPTTPSRGRTPVASSPSGRSSGSPTSSACARCLKQPVIFDGRNLYEPETHAPARLHTTIAVGRAAGRARTDMGRVLITGGAGFIGSHLADRLLARGTR